jgi:predicted histone-like DNA-binding protein
MALKIKAKEKKLKFSKDGPEVYRYVMVPDLYSTLDQDKVIKEAAIRSGVSEGVMQACWKGAGEVIKAWATEGHSVALPGLGNMRFGLSAKAVADVNDVKTSLIRTRRIIFTPTVALKDELSNTAVQITCYDRNGNIVKRVTSADPGTVEEPEGDENGTNGATEQGATEQGDQNGGQNQQTSFALTISQSGTGSASVTKDGNAVASGSNLNEDDEIEISITPAEGQVPTATLNGSEIELTESDGVYTGNFAMPAQASTLVINTGTTGSGGDNHNPIDTGN